MMRLLALLCVMFPISLVCGCRSAPITYYTLTPANRSDTQAEGGRPPIKAILVLRNMPAGIDTTQMLIRTDDTRLRVEEGGRWVAPLGDELRAALVDALRHQYGIVVLDSARHNDTPVPRIDLTVRKFDIAAGRSITLAVDWTLSTAAHEPSSSLSCQAEFTEASAATVNGVVAAAQATVLKLSHALGAAIEATSNGAMPTC
jgi:uncharacterized lipoprotein YmbA